jgi:hypothetical protein
MRIFLCAVGFGAQGCTEEKHLREPSGHEARQQHSHHSFQVSWLQRHAAHQKRSCHEQLPSYLDSLQAMMHITKTVISHHACVSSTIVILF